MKSKLCVSPSWEEFLCQGQKCALRRLKASDRCYVEAASVNIPDDEAYDKRVSADIKVPLLLVQVQQQKRRENGKHRQLMH